MVKRYINDSSLQIAMTEYNEDLALESDVFTETGVYVGTVTQIYDNEHGAGEQVYVVV